LKIITSKKPRTDRGRMAISEIKIFGNLIEDLILRGGNGGEHGG
jgi:hypothetical protein